MPPFLDFLWGLFKRDSEPEVTAEISGLRADGSPYATCYVCMESLIDDLLACFPGYDQLPDESLPSEIPHPYTYKVLIKQPDREIELMVYHQDPRLFPGLWRHPDGTHFHFESESPQRFMDIVEISGINTAGATKAS